MNAVESTTPAHHTPRDVDDSPTGFACEYTISFDLADDPPYGKTYDHADLLPACPKTQKRDSQPNSPGSYGLRSRSLLNLSGLLKKEGTQVRTEEVFAPMEDMPATFKPLTSANGHYHTRQQSLPVDFIDYVDIHFGPAVHEKKRRSFVGWLKAR